MTNQHPEIFDRLQTDGSTLASFSARAVCCG